MRDEHSNSKWWEDQLLPPEDLTPLSQTLISPHLALAFDIPTHHHHHHSSPPPPPPLHHPNSGDFDSSSTGADEPARTLKRPRLVWTPQLHKRFVDAVAHLGIKNAVPKTIMQLMSVDGLTRENVASHLQKYRLYLKRMQGVGVSGGDPASDRLFASSPVPAHFLNPHFVTSPPGYPAIHHQHQHQQQVAAMVAGGGGYHQHHHGRQMGHFAFENSYMTRQVHAMNQNLGSGYADDFESGTVGNGRRVLTLFPTAD